MRYGCVSPTPEMEDMNDSDSDSSDASFEIVSAEGIDDSLTTSLSFKPCIKFHDIFDVYPMDADVVARISTSNDFKISSDDKVVVVPLAWSSVDQAVCVSKLNGFYVRFDVNELPKAPADQFYQLCYCTAEGSVVGVSTPFFFREVHEEDLMEFQKEKNKEFWTFRSRFAVLTDLYWNAVKSNGIIRPDEMSGSCSAIKDSRPDEMSESCSAIKDSKTTEKSSIEYCSANKDPESIDKSRSESSSFIQNFEASDKPSTENCIANKASEITDEPCNCTTNKASEMTEKSLAGVIEDSESAVMALAENVNEKSKNPVQLETTCVNQEPTTANQKVSESAEEKTYENASQMKSKTIAKPTDYSHFHFLTSKRYKDGYRPTANMQTKYMNVGAGKLNVNDSFCDRKDSERIRLVAAAVAPSTPAMQFQSDESKAEAFYRTYCERWQRTYKQPRFDEYYANYGIVTMRLTFFRSLPELIIGRLVLDAMNKLPMDLLETDPFLCEARRQSRYDELIRKNEGNVRMHPTKDTQEPAGSVSQTMLSLTSRVATQTLLVEDLRMQLANESKTIETVTGEYLSYKKEMETRLKHCAKKYAKMCLKLRHFENEGVKNI